MCGVQNTGDIIGLTGLYAANGVRALKPCHSKGENKHTHTHTKKKEEDTWPVTFRLFSKAHTNRASLGDMDIAVNIKNSLCGFGRIINQQWPKLMPKPNFVVCGDKCCH